MIGIRLAAPSDASSIVCKAFSGRTSESSQQSSSSPVLGLTARFNNTVRTANTVAVTDQGFVLLITKGRRQPTTIRTRFDSLDVLGPMNDTDGDAWIEVAGKHYGSRESGHRSCL